MKDINNQQIKQRDYDKEPIVIEDYNYIFLFLFFTFLLSILFLINMFEIVNINKISYIFILVGLIPAGYIYLRAYGKRKIILQNNSIDFLHDSNIIESIYIKDVKCVVKTISIQYHKSQNPTETQKVFSCLFLPLSITIYFFILIIKIIFHFYINGFKSYRFFDSILIYDSDGNFINILPTTIEEREKIKGYFLEKLNIDVDNLEIDKKCLFLGLEKIKI